VDEILRLLAVSAVCSCSKSAQIAKKRISLLEEGAELLFFQASEVVMGCLPGWCGFHSLTFFLGFEVSQQLLRLSDK